jgi:predicted anti-sigma-YlaC factor YlaD
MGLPGDLSCKELVELVTEYLEGGLGSAMRARVEAHLDACAGCREYLEQMRQTIKVLGTLPEESITPEAEQALLRVFRDWKDGRTGPQGTGSQ